MFKDNMRYFRRNKGLSQNEIADALHYKSFTTIQKWEDGTSVPPYSVLLKLANILEVSVDQLMGKEEEPAGIPVVGTVRGGAPIFAQQVFTEFEPFDLLTPNSSDYFCLDVVGDSMKDARILPGDRLFVHRQEMVNNHEIAVVLIGDEATVKFVSFEDDCMVLTPANDAYQPIILTEEDQKENGIKILGKVEYNKIRY